MDNFTLFICGLVVTLIAGMGVITSEVFIAYAEYIATEKRRLDRILKKVKEQEEKDEIAKQSV
jgi:hypothetical protein